MKLNSLMQGNGVLSSKGFTVNELLISIIIMSVLCVLMTPTFMSLRESLVCREAARVIVSTLRVARARAIATNAEHKVEFESANRRYRMLQGNRSHHSVDWNTVIQDWALLPAGVNLHTNVFAIQLNTNGTANGGTLSIQDSACATKYRVVVASTGRIRVRK